MIIIDLTIPGGGVNWPKLVEEAANTALDGYMFINEIYDGANVRFVFEDGSTATPAQCQAILDVHNPSEMTDAQTIDERMIVVKSALSGLDASGGTITLTDEEMADLVTAVQLLLGVYTP